jgi:pyridoxamine 5'-phosphate oxidase
MLTKGGEAITTTTHQAWISRLLWTIDKNSGQIPGLFMQLSTIGLDGSPRCRTVVCRRVENQNPGVDNVDGGGKLLICTSLTSDKWLELKQNPKWEICWYFAHTREQYRLRGDSVHFFQLPMHKEAQEIWNTMSSSAKEMFTKASAPGVNGANESVANEQHHYDTFGVLAFTPKFVQLLELTSGNITSW